jgi:serine/threonine protein kinase
VFLLSDLLRTGRISETLARSILSQLLDAIEHVHSCGYVHRDIKVRWVTGIGNGRAGTSLAAERSLQLENVLLEKETGRVVLIDFGLSGELEKGESTLSDFCGSPASAAPELILRFPYKGRYSLSLLLKESFLRLADPSTSGRWASSSTYS